MTTAETQTIAVTVTEASVASRGDRGDVWQMKLKAPWSNYPIPVSMPRRWAEEVKVNDSLMVTLRKGRLRKPEYDGQREWHYFWEIDEWNATTPATPPQAAPTAAPNNDIFRTKEELRWTEALRIAAINKPDLTLDELLERGLLVYMMLRDNVPDAVPVAVEEAAWDSPQPPPPAPKPQHADVDPGASMMSSGGGHSHTLSRSSEAPLSESVTTVPQYHLCEQHGRAWAQTPAGRLGHPLGNGEWCYQEEA